MSSPGPFHYYPIVASALQSFGLSSLRDRSNTPDLSVGGPLWFALRVRFAHNGEMAFPQLGTGETLAPALAGPVPTRGSMLNWGKAQALARATAEAASEQPLA